MIDDLDWLEEKSTEVLVIYQQDIKEDLVGLKKTINRKSHKLNKIEQILRSRQVITHYHNNNNPKANLY